MHMWFSCQAPIEQVVSEPAVYANKLDARKRAGETIMLGLRRTEGISEQEFASRTGFTLQKLAGPALQRFETLGLVSRTGGRLKLTDRGMEVADTVLCELL